MSLIAIDVVTGVILPILAVLALVAINGVFVAAEFALVGSRRSRIEALADDGNRGARWLLKVFDRPDRQGQVHRRRPARDHARLDRPRYVRRAGNRSLAVRPVRIMGPVGERGAHRRLPGGAQHHHVPPRRVRRDDPEGTRVGHSRADEPEGQPAHAHLQHPVPAGGGVPQLDRTHVDAPAPHPRTRQDAVALQLRGAGDRDGRIGRGWCAA